MSDLFGSYALARPSSVTLYNDDCRNAIKNIADCSIDSVVTDPPYALVSITKRFGGENAAPAKSNGATGIYQRASAGFMGKTWDTGEVAFDPEFWCEILRVLKPGGHVLAFGGTRSYHRLTCAIEDAGFEIRDQIGWLYGTGFPKSHDISKAIDKAAGAERDRPRHDGMTPFGGPGRQICTWCGKSKGGGSGNCQCPKNGNPITPEAQQWQGWGTALKPAWEPICLARKPLIGTVAENVLTHGTGGLNIDGCRVEAGERKTMTGGMGRKANPVFGTFANAETESFTTTQGRHPANIIHDGSDEVIAAFPNGAARFFYSSKASKSDREDGNLHPTVKPTDLMAYLCRLVTPPGGVVLDPFMGSGSTGKAALREGFRFVGIEREAEYFEIAKRRVRT